MHIRTRRISAALIAVATVLVVGLWTMLGGMVIERYVAGHLAIDVPLSQAQGPRPDSYDRVAQPFYVALVGALILAAGCASALAVLIPRWTFRTRTVAYALFLAVLLPASWYNYNQNDTVLPAAYQVGSNLGMIFLGSCVALWLDDLKATAPDTRVLKTLGLVLVLFGAVCVPGLFTLLWVLWRFKVVENPVKLEWSHLTALGGVLSAIIGWLKYRRETRTEATAATPASRIVIPGR